MLPDAVLTVNRNCPSWVISTQHGAVWLSANGELPIEESVPADATLKATAEGGARVVRSARAGIGDIHQAVALGHAYGADAVRGHHTSAHELQGTISLDPQDGHLVAPGVDRDHVATVARDLDCTLGSQPGSRT